MPCATKGIQCYGTGAAVDVEDGPKGSVHTAIRSGCSKKSCTASFASRGMWW